jgi:hypothetical protein
MSTAIMMMIIMRAGVDDVLTGFVSRSWKTFFFEESASRLPHTNKKLFHRPQFVRVTMAEDSGIVKIALVPAARPPQV